MKKGYLISILVVILALFALSVHAQVSNSDLVLGISPQYPAPNQNVTATLSSYSADLDKANIFWSVNSKVVTTGIGKKVFSFDVGNISSSTALEARVDTIDGQSILKTMTITPAGVDMLWEASDSHTPPFYRGKALAPSQGTFKVVAMPSLMTAGGKVSASNLSYSWTKDGNSQPDSSGWGKNYFVFKNSYLEQSNEVDVTASDISGGMTATGKINLKGVNPKIIFYENDPGLGIKWEKALGDGFFISKNGTTFVAEGYFFSPKDINSSDLTFDWFINGEQIPTPDSKNILLIRPGIGQAGSGKIKVAITNTTTLFQNMEKEINVGF